MHVGLFSILTLASVPITPKYAEALKDVPMSNQQNKDAKDALLGNASSASSVSSFWSKLVQSRAGAKLKTDTARAGQTDSGRKYKVMAFTPSPGKKGNKEKEDFQAAVDSLVSFDVKADGASWSQIKDLAIAAAASESILLDIDLRAAALICDFNLKEKARELKAALEAHQQAQKDSATPKPQGVKRALDFSDDDEEIPRDDEAAMEEEVLPTPDKDESQDEIQTKKDKTKKKQDKAKKKKPEEQDEVEAISGKKDKAKKQDAQEVDGDMPANEEISTKKDKAKKKKPEEQEEVEAISGKKDKAKKQDAQDEVDGDMPANKDKTKKKKDAQEEGDGEMSAKKDKSKKKKRAMEVLDQREVDVDDEKPEKKKKRGEPL